MTEAEAKGKWCPFGRVGHRDGMALNDPNLPNFSVRCHGSACMAWRWRQAETHQLRRTPAIPAQRSSVEEPARPSGLPPSWKWNAAYADEGDACWVEPIEEAEARRHGYCGLVGAPTP